MVKGLMAAVIVVALAEPASAETLFQGVVAFTAVSNCGSGVAKGWSNTAQYHPHDVSGVAQSWGNAALDYYSPYGMNGFGVTNGDFPVSSSGTFVTPPPVFAYGIDWGDQFKPGTTENLIIISRSPAAISNTTPIVIIRGKIQNPYFNPSTPNCVANFDFLGVLNTQ